MSLRENVLEALSKIAIVADCHDGVRVTTNAIYPSNGFVQILVHGGPTEYRLSDGGGAFRDIESAGVDVEKDPFGSMRKLVEGHGLSLRNGVIHAPVVSQGSLGVAIAVLANASKECADKFYDTARIRRRKNFKQVVRSLLAKTFEPEQIAPTAIQGASSKTYNFHSVISIGDGKRLAVDAVVCDGNSINSAVVANMDVKARNDPNIIQRIVYDDDDEWTAADLNVLGLGGTLIAFSKSKEAFSRFTRLAARQ